VFVVEPLRQLQLAASRDLLELLAQLLVVAHQPVAECLDGIGGAAVHRQLAQADFGHAADGRFVHELLVGELRLIGPTFLVVRARCRKAQGRSHHGGHEHASEHELPPLVRLRGSPAARCGPQVLPVISDNNHTTGQNSYPRASFMHWC